MHRLPTAVTSLISEHGFQGSGLQELQPLSSVVAAPRPIIMAHLVGCSLASRIFQDQGSNLCLLPWQADSLPLSHLGTEPPGKLPEYFLKIHPWEMKGKEVSFLHTHLKKSNRVFLFVCLFVLMFKELG